MSINVGYLSQYYTLNKINTIDNKLSLNTYNNSNIIFINIDKGSTEDAVINYKNKYAVGLKNNNFVIEDNNCNINIISMSKNSVNINPFILFNNNININNLITTSNNTTYIHCNLQVNLYKSTDRFNVYNNINKNNIFDISTSNINLSIGNTLLNINNSNIYINSDILLGNNNILYTNIIKGVSNSIISIYRPYLIGLQVHSSYTYSSINIINDKQYNKTTFRIKRYYCDSNIVQISTCNLILNTGPDINFIIDNDGLVGIGSIQPSASLSITKIKPTIINYNGLSIGDKFNVSQHANIGIGTANPKSLIDINRCDDLKDNDIRKYPLINMNIDYNSSSNYTTSNSKITYFNIFTYTSNIINSNAEGITNNLIYITSNNVNIDLISNNTINSSINGNVSINVSNNLYVFNNDMYNNIKNISNVIVNNKVDILTIPNIIQIDNNNSYKSYNKIFYPYSLYGNEIISDFVYTSNYNSVGNSNWSTCSYNYGYALMSSNTSIVGYVDSNSSNFDIIYYNNSITSVNPSTYIKYNYKIYIEKNKYLINYFDTNLFLQPSPYFLYATSNNIFCAALSSYSTLSLGSLAPIDNKYLLYAPAKSLLSSIETNTITSIFNDTIGFSHCNLNNINKINSEFITTNSINASNAVIDKITVDFISMNIQLVKELTSSNINFLVLNSDFFKANYSNTHINTQFSIGSSSNYKQLDYNSLSKITVDNSINYSGKIYKHNKALTVTNDNSNGNDNDKKINPSISIYGTDYSLPYLNISTSSSDYYMRINCNLYQYSINEWTDVFQICCDTISNTSRESYYNLTQPHIFQHIKKYNLITIGENNNMCIDVLDRSSFANITQPITNSTNKISMGLPIGILDTNGAIYSDWPQYFNNNIINNINNPYMLNVYGNINFSSINGKSIIKGIVDNGSANNKSLENVNVAIGGEPNINTTLYIYGNGVYNSNLTTSNNLYVVKNAFINNDMTVNGRIYTGGGVTTISDMTIKKDIYVIQHALDKLCSISGYIYTRTDTGNKETGLIAQEVYNILPEVIHKKNSLLNISYGNMSGIIVEAIKELKERVSIIERKLGGMDLS